MSKDTTPLDTSFVAARPENEVPVGRTLRFGVPVAQMLLFVADVLLFVGHIPKEGAAVNSETAGSSPVRNKPDVCAALVEFAWVTLAPVPLLAGWGIEGFKLKIPLRLPRSAQSCRVNGRENHAGFSVVTK